jgi:hypothetical protein
VRVNPALGYLRKRGAISVGEDGRITHGATLIMVPKYKTPQADA